MTRFLMGLMMLAITASATPIPITGSGAYGSFTGSIEYLSGSQSLVLNLTNTTPFYGGFLTGVALNNPGGVITGMTMNTTDSDFLLIGGPSFNNSVSGSPYGDFDFGAALGGNWLGGGSPNPGIPVGGSATFTFNLAGSLAGLTTESFTQALSDNTNEPESLVVRFRGMNCGLSDKVPGEFDPPPPEIPEPGTYALMGAGLALVSIFSRFKK